MDPDALLDKLRGGAYRNVRFRDAIRLVEALGFSLVRRRGSHHIFAHPSIRELVNLQEIDGQAKPYQLRQLLRLVERYALEPEGET